MSSLTSFTPPRRSRGEGQYACRNPRVHLQALVRNAWDEHAHATLLISACACSFILSVQALGRHEQRLHARWHRACACIRQPCAPTRAHSMPCCVMRLRTTSTSPPAAARGSAAHEKVEQAEAEVARLKKEASMDAGEALRRLARLKRMRPSTSSSCCECCEGCEGWSCGRTRMTLHR